MVNLIIYGILALGAITFVGGVVHKYNSAVEGKVAAEAKLKTCSDSYAVTLGQIGRQNAALDALKGERDKAQALAAAALKAAEQAAQARQSERQRLAELQRSFKARGPCPADQAVSKVKEGLK